MQHGFVLPYGDARHAADAAALAEASGWDGFFVWEPVWGIDAWICLTAAAMTTERVRLGTMITPVSRMRPWKLASETATLDNLSSGRVVLSVGLGATDTGFAEFGEVVDRRTRAELLDEGLEIMTGLWAGQPFAFHGKHYQVEPTEFLPPPSPVQEPRIPIWVVGAVGRPRSMRRVANYDGLLPYVMGDPDGPGPIQPDHLAATLASVAQQRGGLDGFDVVLEGDTGPDSRISASLIRELEDAGATWWLESMWMERDPNRVLARVAAGPVAL